MRLIDAIINVIRPEARTSWDFVADCDAICASLGISGYYGYFNDAVNNRFKAYPIFNWQCTDEHVGLDALYLDDEPVGCSYRPARKSEYEIEWISTEKAAKVREFILAALERPEFKLLDPEQDISSVGHINYVGQNLTKEAFLDGRPVTIIGGYDIFRGGIPYGDERYNKFIVKDGDEERLVEPKLLRFPLNLNPVDAPEDSS